VCGRPIVVNILLNKLKWPNKKIIEKSVIRALALNKSDQGVRWGEVAVGLPPHRAVTGPPVDFLTETALSNVVVAPTIVICILYIPTLNGLLKAAWLDKNATAFLPFCGT
jgi:hypothetical protein